MLRGRNYLITDFLNGCYAYPLTHSATFHLQLEISSFACFHRTKIIHCSHRKKHGLTSIGLRMIIISIFSDHLFKRK